MVERGLIMTHYRVNIADFIDHALSIRMLMLTALAKNYKVRSIYFMKNKCFQVGVFRFLRPVDSFSQKNCTKIRPNLQEKTFVKKCIRLCI